MKFKTYRGGDIQGKCIVTKKIDGVRAHKTENGWVSRTGKPLYNLPSVDLFDGDVYEVYLGSWEDTVSAVRTKSGDKVSCFHMYEIYPSVDGDLLICTHEGISQPAIDTYLNNVLQEGYEGLVIRNNENIFYKVKPVYSHDLVVLDILPGKGKHEGKVGALVTELGNVGTGLSDYDREKDWIGKVIEVESMGLTPSGKMRHPRFIRHRLDKE